MAESTYQHIRFEVADRVATITFALPQYRNALHTPAIQEVVDALNRAEAREDVGAVVLTGEGEAFCAGFNLKEIPLEGTGPEKIEQHFQHTAMWWHQLLGKIIRIGKPVLAAVNGVAAGSGLGMTLAADLAVGNENARLFCAWHSINIANDAGTSYTLAKIVGFRRAMEMMLTNRTLHAKEAQEWGVLNRAYLNAEFAGNVAKIARDLAEGPTQLQAMAKERLHSGWRQSIEESNEYEIQNVITSVKEPLFRNTLESFVAGNMRSDATPVTLP